MLLHAAGCLPVLTPTVALALTLERINIHTRTISPSLPPPRHHRPGQRPRPFAIPRTRKTRRAIATGLHYDSAVADSDPDTHIYRAPPERLASTVFALESEDRCAFTAGSPRLASPPLLVLVAALDAALC